MDSRVFLAKLKKFGFEKQYKKMIINFNKHAKPGDGFYFIDGGRELGFQVHPVADMMMGPKIKKLGDTQDLGGGKTARLIAIKEGVQVDENIEKTLLNYGMKKMDGLGSKKVLVKFVVDADQNSYQSITRDPALKKLPGFLGLHNIVFHSRKKKAEFTFRTNKKGEEKFKKLLKKHGLKLVDTIYEGSKKLDEQGPLGGGLTNPTLPFLPQVAQRQKTGRSRAGRREIGRRRPAPGLVNPGGLPIQFEALAARDIQGMIKGLNKKAKQEIAGVLNDMNLSGYGDYEARADNVHKFKPKDLLKAMNKVMKLEQANIVEFNDKFMKKGKYASKQDKAHHAKKRKEFERELKKAGIKFHFVAGNRKGPVEDTYYVSFKNNAKAHQIANKLFAGAVFSSEIQQFRISAVSEVSFSEFSESVQLDEGRIDFVFDIAKYADAFAKRVKRENLASKVKRSVDRSFAKPKEVVTIIGQPNAFEGWPNAYEKRTILRLAKGYDGEFFYTDMGREVEKMMRESVQIDEMSARDHYRRYKNKNRVTSIDRERFPNREREGLEGPYRTKKTGLIYYYDTKAKKYYDPQTDMYLSVDDIMEGMGINESDHYSKKDLFTDRDIKKLSKAYGNENYEDGYRGDKQDLPGAVKDMLRYINNYSNNDLIVIALADIPYASTQAMIQLESIRGYKIKSRPPKRRSDFVKK
jgi:hypothetical protein